MHTDKLVQMANQIGAFFDAMPDRSEALEGIVQHLRKFWDPRMRRTLLAHVDCHADGEAGGEAGTGLSATVAEAIKRHRGLLG